MTDISERTLSTALGALATARAKELKDHTEYVQTCNRCNDTVSISMMKFHNEMIERYDLAIEEMEKNDPIFGKI